MTPDSIGHDQGERLPNFNDDYTGAGPDTGAHEAGTPPMEFGANAYQNTPTTDTTPPLVTLIAPSSYASGTVSVSADASDVGDSGQAAEVAGVQFTLDGINLDGEDTVAPYSTSWDTTHTTNGVHTLTAKARDLSGNIGTSTVAVTVNNAITTLTFTPTADATTKAGSPSTNYGASSKVEIDNSPVEQFLMKFVVSGVAGQTVKSAKLRLYNVNSSNKGGDFYRVADNGWNESTVTWNIAQTLATDGMAFASLNAVSANTWYEVDVKVDDTPLITGDGTYTLLVKSTSGDGADYSSKEAASNKPQLVVTLQQP